MAVVSHSVRAIHRSYPKLYRNYVSTTSALSNDQIQEENSEPQIPLVPKKRDPHAVLKALSSTVSPLKDPYMMGRSLADPLAPRDRRQMIEFYMAKEAGRAAAIDVIHSNPKLFNAYTPLPNLSLIENKEVTGTDQEALKELVRKRMTEEALALHKTLTDQKEPIDLDIANSLLALLAYSGSSNEPAPVFPSNDSSSESEESSTILFETIKPKSVWTEDNKAHEFFNEMIQKDGGSYGAMIQGMAKYDEFELAFELFTEARSKGFQLSLNTYNSLLLSLTKTGLKEKWEKTKSILAEMVKDPTPVQPDTRTFNCLLKVVSMMDDPSHTASRINAMELMREMFELGLKPTLTTLLLLLNTFMKQDDYTVLKEIINYIEENEKNILTIQQPADIYFFSAAMEAARIARDSTLAVRIKALAEKGHWFLVDSIEFFLNNYLVAVASGSDMALLLNDYEKVVPSVYTPREWIFPVLFKQCEINNAPDIALKLFNSVLARSLQIKDPMTLLRLIGALNRPIDPAHCKDYLVAVQTVWKKFEFLKFKPTQLMIALTIKLLLIDEQLDEAWEYYKLFKKYDMQPSFLALAAFLKFYHRSGNNSVILELLDLMIENGYFMPLNFVRDVCVKAGVSSTETSRYLDKFSRNSSQNKRVSSPPEAVEPKEFDPSVWETPPH